MVNPPVKVLAPERVNCDVALFWMTPVTFVPMTALIVVVPLPEPEFVIVPMLFTEFVDKVIVAPLLALCALIVILPVPVTPPVNTTLLEKPPVVEVNVRLLFNVTAPLKVVL